MSTSLAPARSTWRDQHRTERAAARKKVAEAARIRSADERRYGVNSIYVLEGPSGTYVGCTSQPEKRLRSHQSQARSRSNRNQLCIHRAMKRDGIELYSFRIVAQAKGHYAAEETEFEVIQQLRSEGARVLNVHPRTPAHNPPNAGRVNYVVVNGERQAL